MTLNEAEFMVTCVSAALVFLAILVAWLIAGPEIMCKWGRHKWDYESGSAGFYECCQRPGCPSGNNAQRPRDKVALGVAAMKKSERWYRRAWRKIRYHPKVPSE